jgi:hypothetical protein
LPEPDDSQTEAESTEDDLDDDSDSGEDDLQSISSASMDLNSSYEKFIQDEKIVGLYFPPEIDCCKDLISPVVCILGSQEHDMLRRGIRRHLGENRRVSVYRGVAEAYWHLTSVAYALGQGFTHLQILQG